MKTLEEILAALEAEHSQITEIVNGVAVILTDSQRDSKLATWAQEIYRLDHESTEKIWPNAQVFLAEFSMPERAAISLSANPIIAALRMTLSTWLTEVHADHDDVIMGLNALVSEGIITAARKDEILA